MIPIQQLVAMKISIATAFVVNQVGVVKMALVYVLALAASILPIYVAIIN